MPRAQKTPPITAAELGYLRRLAQANPLQRRSLLLQSSGRKLRLISECCLNFLRESFRVPPATVTKLRPYKRVIRTLATKRSPVGERRRLLVQQGGFLPLLIPAAISFLSHLLTR